MVQSRSSAAVTLFWGALTVVFALLAGMFAPVPAQATEVNSVLEIQKTVSVTDIAPGESFEYQISLGCSSLIDIGCRDVVITDMLPEGLLFNGDITFTGVPGIASNVENALTLTLDEDIEEGVKGMYAGDNVVITIPVILKPEAPFALNGAPLVNTATATASNAAPTSDFATVLPHIEHTLTVQGSKSYDPESGVAQAGTETTLTLRGNYNSNAGVDTLTLVDPGDTAENPFTYFTITRITGFEFPEGAASATTEYLYAGGWAPAENGPTFPGVGNPPAPAPEPGLPTSEVYGVRVTYHAADGSQLSPSGSGAVSIHLAQKDNVSELTEDTTITNTLLTEATGEGKAEQYTSEAEYTILDAQATVKATKSFSPSTLVPGQSTQITVGAQNTSLVPLTSLTIREPAEGRFGVTTENEQLLNAKWLPSGPVPFPAGESRATILVGYTTSTGQAETEIYTFNSGDEPDFPEPVIDAASINFFEITYEGTIEPGANVELTFEATANPNLQDEGSLVNRVLAAGQVTPESQPITSEAEAPISVVTPRLELDLQKTFKPAEIWGYQGTDVLVELPTTVVETSETHPGSNINAKTVTVSDPAVDANGTPQPSPFWEHFTPKRITNTDIPEHAKLTVNYWDTSANPAAWVPVPGMTDRTGTIDEDLPEEILSKIGGLQYVYTSDTGFEPHSLSEPNFLPRFTATLNSSLLGDETATFENCGNAAGEGALPGSDAPLPTTATSPTECAELTVKPPPTGPGIELIEKAWSKDSLVQRTDSVVTTTLKWSTAGLPFPEITIGDSKLDPVTGNPTQPLTETAYDAFNLTAILPITNDAGIAAEADEVSRVEIWNSVEEEWVTPQAALHPASLPFQSVPTPTIELTPEESEFTTAVRIVFTPRLANGALVETAAYARQIPLEWQLRDTLRSDTSIPVTEHTVFNENGQEGAVTNTTSATGQLPDPNEPGEYITVHDTESDDILILEQPLGVSVSKGWSGGPMGTMPDDVPESSYPTSRVTITAQNTSQQKVDTLIVTEPSTPDSLTFETFNLYRIASISNNLPGADKNRSDVRFTLQDGTTKTVLLTELAQTSTEFFAEVVKIEVQYFGRIEAGAKSTITLDLQLRKTYRSDSGHRITAAHRPVENTVTAVVEDLDRTTDADDTKLMNFSPYSLGVTSSKTFTPDFQLRTKNPREDDYAERPWDEITMKLTGRPTGTGRISSLVLTDSGENQEPDTATAENFWNAFTFNGFTDDELVVPRPFNRVQVEVLRGHFEIPSYTNDLLFVPDTNFPGGWEPGTDEPFTVTGTTLADAADKLIPNIDPSSYDSIYGIRLTYWREDPDGTRVAIENPANPLAQVSLQVQRRAYLAAAQPAPWPLNGDDPEKEEIDRFGWVTASDEPPAPGLPQENTGGKYTNTLHVTVESAARFPVPNSEQLEPLYAHSESTDEYYYWAEGVEISVEKTPRGAQAPGSVIPFQLTATNTAQRIDEDQQHAAAILDPYFDDILPVNEQGDPLLVFDPDDDPADYFSFTLENKSPLNLDPLPTTQPLVKVSLLNAEGTEVAGDEEPVKIRFSFPDDSTLYPLEVYRITANMMFRPGVSAGPDHQITNQLEVSNTNQDFSTCNGVPAETKSKTCSTETAVYPTELGALRGNKFVRVDAPAQLGLADIPNPTAGKECVPYFSDNTVEAFWSKNCVPISQALGLQTWREEMQNTGTLPLDKVVTIDSLPRVGDSGALVLLPRNSEWQPTWVGNTQVVTSKPDESTQYNSDLQSVELFYSSVIGPPCSADLRPAEPEQCDNFWKPLTEETDLTTVKHVKTVFMFEDALLPGERFAFTFDTRSPAMVPSGKPQQVAWNTVAIGAQAKAKRDSVDVISSVIPTEALRVGVALAAGPFAVTKKVEQTPGAFYAPSVFQLEAHCRVTAPDNPEIWADLDPIKLTDVEKDSLTTPGTFVPTGAKCTVRDDGALNGETSSSVDPEFITIGEVGDATPAITLTNTYNLGSFQVSKAVEGPRDQNGNSVMPQTYGMSVSCSFLGDVVLSETNFELTSGQGSWEATNLPVGAICTLKETVTHGASPELSHGDTIIPATDPDQAIWEFTVPDPSEAEATLDLTLTNTFPTGSISIAKSLNGAGKAFIPANTLFTFEVLCTWEGNTVYEDELSLTADQAVNDEQITISTLPIGALCSVEETQAGGAHSNAVEPAMPTAVTPDSVLEFEVSNTFPQGEIRIIKTLDGAAADRIPDDTVFTFDVLCTWQVGDEWITVYDSTQQPVPLTLTARQIRYEDIVIAVTDLPQGARCTASESGSGGASTATVLPSVAIAGPLSDPTVFTATNTYEPGAIEITKTLTGNAAERVPDNTTYTFGVVCTWNTTEVYNQTHTLTAKQARDGETITIDDLPETASCTVTETGIGGATTSAVTPNTATAVGTPEDPTVFTATNTYEPGAIEITKTLTGNAAERVLDTVRFSFGVQCTWGNSTVYTATHSLTAAQARAGESIVIADLPQSSLCLVTETETGGAATSTVEPSLATTVGSVEEPAAFLVTNTYTADTPPAPSPIPPVNPDHPAQPSTRPLSFTGAPGSAGAEVAIAVAVLVLGSALLLVSWARRRSSRRHER